MPDRISESSGSHKRPSGARLALRFISGKYQGGEFPLDEFQEIAIGRSSDLDMVLVEEMVSRRHARITMEQGVVSIEDLGSTNGTFVNGEKIQRATLQEGDRVLIGTSILKLVTVAGQRTQAGSHQVVEKSPTVRHNEPATAVAGEAPRMSGSLEEIPLPDLMQLFGTSKKTGVLVLRADGHVGRIYLRDGLVYFAQIEEQPEVFPVKACFRMLSWKNGFFELDPPDQTRFDNEIALSAQEMLMEGFRQMDEFANLRHRLPEIGARLVLRTPLDAPLHELEPTHLEVLQTALNSDDLQALMDRTEVSDLRTAQIVLDLIKRGYLKAG
jgi:pSer/pThr/pTyr-binding forkhead associated (FHA) protein